MEDKQMAVVVNNLYFAYNKFSVTKSTLVDVNLCVPKSGIYALIGPSGCGKTTLFKLVIGLLKPNLGSISVFGHSPGTRESGVPGKGVGYMPQQQGLQNDLTIGEILCYFGYILGLPQDQLKRRINFLISSLDLPEKSRLIGNTSGGQQRRVSLAIAILHKPRLLILDEPTVGVDPILCQTIWHLLLTLREKHQTTILLTTHYIEETRKANVVGFMRRGEILEEDSPTELLRKYDSHCLECVFLKLSKTQKANEKLQIENSKRRVNCVNEPFERSNVSNRSLFQRRVLTIIHKYMIETRRNLLSMAFLFIFSFVTATLVTFWFGKTPEDITVAWIVHDKRFDFNRSLFDPEYEELPFLPDLLNDALNKKLINLRKYSDFSLANEDLEQGSIYGIIYLSSNFSNCYLECNSYLQWRQIFIDNRTIDCGNIHLYVDSTNRVISSVIEISIRDSVVSFAKATAKYFEMDPKTMDPWYRLIPIYGTFDAERIDIFGVNDFIGPGSIFLTSYMFGILSSIINALNEQNNEMLSRNYVSGVSAVHLVSAQLIARFIFMAASNLINVFCSIYLLSLPCYGSLFYLLTLFWTTSAIGILQGILTAVILPNTIFCIFCAIALTFNTLWMGTVIWNLESQPMYVRWVQYVLPFALPLKTVRSLMAKQNAPFHPFIWPGFAMNFAWIAILYVGCVYFMNIKK